MPMPTKYRPEFCKIGRKLCLLGATDKQLSDFFEVAESNLREWKSVHPEFGEALRQGKLVADARVAQALYINALRGNVMAQMYWLNNRQRENWRQRQEISGPNGGAIPVEVTDLTSIQAARAVAFAMAEGADMVKRAQKTGNAAGKTPLKEKVA